MAELREVKAEYIVSEDSETGEEVKVKIIPPSPSDGDLGGVTEEEREQIEKNKILDVEVTQSNSTITANHTFDEMLTAYSEGREIRVRFTSDGYSGKQFVFHNVGHSETKTEFHTVMELSDKLIFLELECDNQDNWDLYSKQYLPADSYYLAVADGAGAHNAVYRGKNLGMELTDEQLERIKDGTFKDLFIGDYWERFGVRFLIADFDYMYGVGNTGLETHHILVIPMKRVGYGAMYDTNITGGGYVGSKMYKDGLSDALTTFKNMFGESHVLRYNSLLVNLVDEGEPISSIWRERQIDLMSEVMVCGTRVWENNGHEVGCQKSQLSLFKHRHDLICIRDWYWLRDVATSTSFSAVESYGTIGKYNASSSGGIRPFVLVGEKSGIPM